MTITPFSQDNLAFTAAAHQAAQDILYPRWLGINRNHLEFVSCTGNRLDCEMGIDRIIKIQGPHPEEKTVQERFRKGEFKCFRDITITSWNNITNLPSELQKIKADLFVYGYYLPERHDFVAAWMIDSPRMIELIKAGQLPYTTEKNPRSNQPFVAVKVSYLHEHGLILGRYPPLEKPWQSPA